MEYAPLGTSNVEVSRVIFGAWAIGGWAWGGTDDEDAIEAIKAAVDAGMSTIDTAPVYGFGHSEEVVGRALKDIPRDEVVVATKCGLRWDTDEGHKKFQTERRDGTKVWVRENLSLESIMLEIDRSLERLRLDYVDLYQCHWPDPTTPIAETMDAMNDVLDSGKARAIGVSNFSVEQMQKCLNHGSIASDQPLYNMLDRDIEDDILPFCHRKKVGVIVYSPLHQGLLTGKVDMDREFDEGDWRKGKWWFQPEQRRAVLDFLEKVKPIAETHGKTLAQVAINWCLCQRGVTSAIVGARNPEQVRENAAGAGWKLSDEELNLMREWINELEETVGEKEE